MGSQFKQYTTRLPKVDGMEVAAIDHRRNVQVFVDEPPAPGLLGTVVNHPPCNMMDNTHSHVSIGSLRGAQYVDTRARAPLAYVETEAVGGRPDLPEPQGPHNLTRAR